MKFSAMKKLEILPSWSPSLRFLCKVLTDWANVLRIELLLGINEGAFLRLIVKEYMEGLNLH